MNWLRRFLRRGMPAEVSQMRREAEARSAYVHQQLIPEVEEQTRRLERLRQQNHYGAMIEAVIKGNGGQ